MPDRASITALLGPTNTGKTHRAVERMLEHTTGMIGLPLRLLAREVYDRISRRIGESRVALVTGEEKRVPHRPSYWVCTVEAMPVGRDVDFLAVDEVQLCSHRQRGHVFTDRVLHARGRLETWFMGSDTMEPLIRQMLPTAQVQRHPRLSTLRTAGSLALSALPPRSAVVAFSAPQVYELAERIRRKRGGAAVVLGALSPRTRNAQVALYQSGEVQYMVATDAIGMGLNMDIDLVAFAALDKFDGRDARMLETAELAQIAGRAGRHTNDGRFGTLAPVPALPDPISFAIETHRFPPVRHLVWRNSDLDTSSVDALVESLKRRPPHPWMRPVEQADDSAALLHLALRPTIQALARSPERVALLWSVCQIPDFRQLMPEVHASLLEEIFVQLAGSSGTIDPAWIDQRITRLDDPRGDIDTLMTRIAFVRTWTYVANHGEWVRDAEHWQLRAREVEDRLSDALHDRLVQRFVSRSQTTRASRGPAPRRPAPPAIEPSGPAFHAPFRVLASLRLRSRPDEPSPPPDVDWVQELCDAPHERFRLGADGRIFAGSERLARLVRGTDLLHPEVSIALDHDPGPGARLRLQRRLVAWVRDEAGRLLGPLRSEPARQLSPPGRGVIYQLEQGLGTTRTQRAREQLDLLTAQDWALLRAMGVRTGRHALFVRSLIEPSWVALRSALCSAWLERSVLPPPPGALASRAPDGLSDAMWLIGYPVFGGWALRADLVLRIEGILGQAARGEAFAPPPAIRDHIGCQEEELPAILESFGMRSIGDGTWRAPGSRRRRHRARRPPAADQ